MSKNIRRNFAEWQRGFEVATILIIFTETNDGVKDKKQTAKSFNVLIYIKNVKVVVSVLEPLIVQN